MSATRKSPRDRLAGKKPRTTSAGIYLDEAVVDAVDDAERALLDAQTTQVQTRVRRVAEALTAHGGPDPASDVAARVLAQVDAADEAVLAPLRQSVEAAKADADAATVWFRFQALGRRAWQALVDEHPPTPEDHAIAKAGGQAAAAWNYETLPPALIGAACVSPQLSAEQVEAIWTEWNDAEAGALVQAAVSAQSSMRPPAPRESAA